MDRESIFELYKDENGNFRFRLQERMKDFFSENRILLLDILHKQQNIKKKEDKNNVVDVSHPN